EVGVVALRQLEGLLILLVFQMLLELLRQVRRHEHRLADLQKAHHEQGHEPERQEQEDDDVLDAERLEEEREVALSLGLLALVSRDLLVLRDGHGWGDRSGSHSPGSEQRGHDHQSAEAGEAGLPRCGPQPPAVIRTHDHDRLLAREKIRCPRPQNVPSGRSGAEGRVRRVCRPGVSPSTGC
ncbi:MAG: hypothetical protein ACK56I_14785, partial [bacterium]